MRKLRNVVTLTVALTVVGASSAQAQTGRVGLSEGDQELIDAYYAMQGVTMGLMGVTATLGLAQLYNLPTVFGEGACRSNQAILGDFACSGGLSLVHGAFGVLTLASFATTGGLGIAAPQIDGETEDDVTDVLGTVAAVGIGLTSVMGILAANPGILGIEGNDAYEFSRVLRVVHWLVALTTVGVFATHIAVDHID